MQAYYGYGEPTLIAAVVVLGIALLGCVLACFSYVPAGLARWKALSLPWKSALVALIAAALLYRVLGVEETPEIRVRLQWAYFPEVGPGTAEAIYKYGLGLPFLSRTAVLIGGVHESSVFWMNRVLGTMSVVVMMMLVRGLGANRATAFCAGFALAITPLHVRYSVIDSPFTADTFFMLLMMWSLVTWLREGRWTLWWGALGAGVIVTQMRIESVLVWPMAALLCWAVADNKALRDHRVWKGLLIVGIALIPHLSLVGPQFLHEVGYRNTSASGVRVLSKFWWMMLTPSIQPSILVALTVVGLGAAGVPWRVRLWAAVGLTVNAAILPEVRPRELAFSIARYQMRSLPYAAVLAGVGLGELFRTTWSRYIGLASVVVASVQSYRLTRPRTLLTKEHHFVREILPSLPTPCRIYTIAPNSDTTLYPPTYLSHFAGRPTDEWQSIETLKEWTVWRREMEQLDCRLYYRSSKCSENYEINPSELDVCRLGESQMRLTPLHEVQLPPDPMSAMGIADSTGEPLIIGFYRIEGFRD